jgi:hypothetical protein
MDGKPVPYFGFAITESADDRYVRPTSVRDPDGRFTEKDAMPGTFAVVIIGPGFERRAVDNVRVVDGQVTDLGDITVQRGAVIRGRVTDTRGVPVSGATVRVVAGDTSSTAVLTQMSRGERTAITDVSGMYEIAGLPSAMEGITLEATHPERGSSATMALVAGQTRLDLVLQTSGTIAGTLVRGRHDQDTAIATSAGDHRIRLTADIDSLGSFVFEHVAAGEYTIEILGKDTVPEQQAIVLGGATTEVRFEMPDDQGKL